MSYSIDQTRTDGALPACTAAPLYQRITAAGTYVLKTSLGQLYSIIGSVAGMTVVVYDGTSAAGTEICTLVPAAGSVTPISVQLLSGICVVVTGTGDILLTYR